MLGDKIKTKKIKGKQNKKKWRKNIDVSELFEHIHSQKDEERRKSFAKESIVEDNTPKVRTSLDPDRFKNKPIPLPKPQYDNSYKRDSVIEDQLADPWANNQPVPKQKRANINIPAIIKPQSGHSYNAREEHVEEIIDQVIDYEKQRPKKQKKIKKLVDKVVVPRTRDKKKRREYLEARQRKLQRMRQHQVDSYKKVNKEIDEKNRKTEEKIANKEHEKEERMKENLTGKVRIGPKIGKKRYKFEEYIPEEGELGKKMSTLPTHDQLMKDRFDTIFRRGIMEPRMIKVHRNKKKNRKVKQFCRQ